MPRGIPAALLQVRQTDIVLGRKFSGAGLVEEIPCTSAARSLLDDTTAGQMRTTLGATTVGGSLFTLSNPSAITFPRINADNTVSALSASDFRTAIGAGTVSSVAVSSSIISVSGSPITGSGTVTLGLTTSGSGTTLALVNSPAFTTPDIGTPSAGTLTNTGAFPPSTTIYGRPNS
jgi:hypothetical protein